MKYFRCKNCGFLWPVTDADYIRYHTIRQMIGYEAECCDCPVLEEDHQKTPDVYDVKYEIYRVLRTYFGGFNTTAHEVAEDFTRSEFDKLLSEYYNYLMK